MYALMSLALGGCALEAYCIICVAVQTGMLELSDAGKHVSMEWCCCLLHDYI